MITPLPPGWHQNYRDNHQPHRIYRCYDADGVLLYIGCTIDIEKRMRGHLGTTTHGASPWLRACMDRYEVDADVYVGRTAGQAAEAEAISAEQPVFNLQHSRRGHSFWKVVVGHYLVERGLVDLARSTACACWRETREAGGRDSWCEAHRDEDRPTFRELVEMGGAA